MSLAVLRLAIVGAGQFANIAAGAWSRVPAVRITAVADTRPEAAHALAARFGADVVSPEDAVGGGVADIAYVATPPWLQLHYASMALRAGMHVVCEKPMALHADDARALADEAKRAQRVLTLDFMQRHGPLAIAVRRVIDLDLLGAPLHAYFENYASDQDLPHDHWFWDRRQSGGIFVEHAVHFFDLFRWWLGPGEVVSAFVVPRDGDHDIQDQVQCTAVHGTVLVDQYHGFHQPRRLDRQRLGILFERGDIALQGWIPISATVRGVVDEAGRDELVELFAGQQIACTAVPTATHARGRTLDDVLDVTIGTDEADKPTLYVDMLEARFRDAVAAIRDPGHVQRVTAGDAAEALSMATQATRQAHVVDRR